MWKSVSLLAVLSCAAAQDYTGCPPDKFPVSVIGIKEVQCLDATPCSGVYIAGGLPQGSTVGACPSNTGCAILPGQGKVLGCVVEGMPDVRYVNPDGTIKRDGDQPVESNTHDSNNEPASPQPDDASPSGSLALSASASSSQETSSKPPTDAPSTSLTTDTSSTSSQTGATSTSDSASEALEPTRTPASSMQSAGSSFESASVGSYDSINTKAREQTVLRKDESGTELKSSDKDEGSGPSMTSIIGVIAACAGVAAIAIGAVVMKRRRDEDEMSSPEGVNVMNVYGDQGNLSVSGSYGDDGDTPKENVILL